MADPIPFVGLAEQASRLRTKIESALRRVLDHGRYVNGPEIPALEAELSKWGECVGAVGLSSGTDALVVCLAVMGIGKGDAVFVPSFTFPATAEVVLWMGAEPVFVDVDEATYNIDLEHLRAQIGEVGRAGRLRPRCVIAVDLFGLPASYPALAELCAEADLELIADAAQSFGGRQNGRPVGSLAPLTATSFFPAKPLGAYGDGGAVLVRDEASLLPLLRSIREHGQGEQRYDIVRLGINGRLDSFQAAVLLVKLEVFGEELARRDQVARCYQAGLEGAAVVCPPMPSDCQCAWAQYTLQVAAEERDRVRAALLDRGVPTAVYYPLPLHMQPAYHPFGSGKGSLPASEALASRVFSLPMHPYLEDRQIDRVVETLWDVLEGGDQPVTQGAVSRSTASAPSSSS